MSIQSILIIKGGSPKLTNMLLDKDGATNQVIVEALLENECQFLIHHENAKVRVAFHEGMWKIMQENGDYFVFYDSFGVEECNNKLLEGVIRSKIEVAEKRNWNGSNVWRKKPAWVISQVLELWIGEYKDIVSINVIQFGRDGWFVNFND